MEIFDIAVDVRVLDENTTHIGADSFVFKQSHSISDDDIDPEPFSTCTKNRDRLRQDTGVHDERLFVASRNESHNHPLSGGSRLIKERRVCNVHRSQ